MVSLPNHGRGAWEGGDDEETGKSKVIKKSPNRSWGESQIT